MPGRWWRIVASYIKMNYAKIDEKLVQTNAISCSGGRETGFQSQKRNERHFPGKRNQNALN